MFRDNQIIGELRGPWGVPVQFGASIFVLPLIFIDFGGTPRTLAFDLMFLAILLASIFLHELGHAWGNLIQGIPVGRILLYGGGGLCSSTRSATRRERELVVAMGPIVNLALWAVASLVAPRIGDPEVGWVVDTVAWINLYLAIFNLMPVQPLDGGKLFELFLHRLLPPMAALRVAGTVGLLIVVAWVPLLIGSWVTFGMFLFFLPSLGVHWRMARGVSA